MKSFAPIRKLIATPEPPELGPGPRVHTEAPQALDLLLNTALKEIGLPSHRAELVRATVLLWHDHLDGAHTIAQSIENADGSYVHGIMHRREPDYGNAKYWFRRVGDHPCFAALAGRGSRLIKERQPSDRQGFLLREKWDPFAFIDACERVAVYPPSNPEVQLLREIQAAEFEVLLEYFCAD